MKRLKVGKWRDENVEGERMREDRRMGDDRILEGVKSGRMEEERDREAET